VLPALCESMIVAYVSYASGVRGELEAYMRLIDLGTPPNGIDSNYTSSTKSSRTGSTRARS
jgi:hypothetical protein